MDCHQSLHVQTWWCMGTPDPSAREIMGNRQAGQRCSLCLHNEQRDGVRGHPQMCSGDGILSGCLNKASPSPVLFSLCHPCLPDSLSFMSLTYFFCRSRFSSRFDVWRTARRVKPEEPSQVKLLPSVWHCRKNVWSICWIASLNERKGKIQLLTFWSSSHQLNISQERWIRINTGALLQLLDLLPWYDIWKYLPFKSLKLF